MIEKGIVMAKKMTYKNIAAAYGKENEVSTVTVDMNGQEVSFQVSKRIGMNDMLKLVNGVASTVIDEETGAYAPELEDMITKLYILHYYAGFPLPGNDLADAYFVIYNTPLYDAIAEHIDKDQRMAIMVAAGERIAYLCDLTKSTAARKASELLSAFEQLFGMIQSIGEGLDAEGLHNAVASLTKMLDGAAEEKVPEKGPDKPDGGNVVQLPRVRAKSVSKA